jgi:hypothetical protein
MCPAAHHIVCSELILSAAAEAVAAASILVGLSKASASASASATAPTTTTPTATAIDSTAAVANAKPKSFGAAKKITISVGTGQRLEPGCLRVNLVVGYRRLKSLIAVRCAAGERPEDSVVNSRVVPQPESVAPQPETVVVGSATKPECCAPVIVASSDEDNDDDDHDLPSLEEVSCSSSFSAASFAAAAAAVAVAVAEADADNTDDDTTSELWSSEMRLVFKSSGEDDDDDDLPPLEEAKDSSSANPIIVAADAITWSSKKQVAVARSFRGKVLEDCFPRWSPEELMEKVRPMIAQANAERWQERLRRPGRGGRYAEMMAAARSTPRGGRLRNA